MILVKFILWVFGLALTATPLVASVWTTPGSFDSAFALASYSRQYGELIFIGVAVGAVAIAEAMELLIDIRRNERGAAALAALSCGMLLLLVVFCAIWYGRYLETTGAGQAAALDDLQGAFIVVSVIVAIALALKVLLWSRQ